MTDGNGKPVRRRSGEVYRHKMRPGDDARAIAVVMTKAIYNILQGDSVAGFNRPLNYARLALFE